MYITEHFGESVGYGTMGAKFIYCTKFMAAKIQVCRCEELLHLWMQSKLLLFSSWPFIAFKWDVGPSPIL